MTLRPSLVFASVEDPDLLVKVADPDPHQNVTAFQHWFWRMYRIFMKNRNISDLPERNRGNYPLV
jgi:hypothetical protein